MSTDPIRQSAQGLDLSARSFQSTTVAASPAAAAETIIASLTCSAQEAVTSGIRLNAWAAFTVGTNGTAVRLRIRKTDVAGTVVADSGAVDAGVAATKLLASAISGNDASPTLPGQVYVLTLTVTAGSAASTVSAVSLQALVV